MFCMESGNVSREGSVISSRKYLTLKLLMSSLGLNPREATACIFLYLGIFSESRQHLHTQRTQLAKTNWNMHSFSQLFPLKCSRVYVCACVLLQNIWGSLCVKDLLLVTWEYIETESSVAWHHVRTSSLHSGPSIWALVARQELRNNKHLNTDCIRSYSCYNKSAQT